LLIGAARFKYAKDETVSLLIIARAVITASEDLHLL
jgi:hypothetical protein